MDLALQCLEQRRENLKSEVKEEEKKLWSVDMDKNRKITVVEGIIRKYNSKLPALGIAPESELYLDMHRPIAQVRADLQELLHSYRGKERQLDGQLEQSETELSRLETDKKHLSQETDKLAKEIDQLRASKEDQGVKITAEDQALSKEIDTLRRDNLQYRERGSQDLNALRGELSERQSAIRERESRNERQAQEGCAKMRSDLAKAKAFIADKVKRRNELLAAYKRRAEEEIVENLQMVQGLKAACEERGLGPDKK